MKTTIDISDSLFKEAKRFTAERGETLRELVEASLHHYLESCRSKRQRSFKLKDCSFKGEGLVEGMREGDWPAIRSLIYEGHAG